MFEWDVTVVILKCVYFLRHASASASQKGKKSHAHKVEKAVSDLIASSDEESSDSGEEWKPRRGAKGKPAKSASLAVGGVKFTGKHCVFEEEPETERHRRGGRSRH